MTTLHTGRLHYRRANQLSLALLLAVFTLFGAWLTLHSATGHSHNATAPAHSTAANQENPA